MAIKRLVVDNFRSIDHLELELGPLNAFIGPNNAGKSNILSALNLVLGETWPSRLRPENDFHVYNGPNPNRPIEIEIVFTEPLVCESSVQGFHLRYTPGRESPDYFPIDSSGTFCTWPRGGAMRVSNEMRSERALLYLDLNRQAEEQIRPTQWTLFGKLLSHVNNTIDATARGAFTTAVTASFDEHVRGKLAAAQTIIDNFVRRQTGLQVKLEFGAINPLDVLKNVRPYIIDSSISLDSEDVGAGVQSALAIGIAQAYALLVRVPLVLALEEPELYLHPHGCRHFYRLLRELVEAGNLQVLYTTHSRSFVDAGDFDALHPVRKRNGATEVKSGSSIALGGAKERLRIQSKFDERINEVFFASCGVLTEGPADEIACRCALEKLGIELDRQSVSIIDLGGSPQVPILAEVLTRLEIPTLAILDQDPGNQNTASLHTRTETIVGAANLFLQIPRLEEMFDLTSKPSRIDAMEFFPDWLALNPMPQMYQHLADRIGQILN